MAIRKASAGIARRAASFSFPKILIIAVAIIAGSMIIRGRVQAPQAQVKEQIVVAEFDTVNVPVPAEAVAAGTKVKNIRWKTISFPKHQLPKGALTDATPYLDAATVAAIPANLPVFPENLSFAVQGVNPVVERIPSGMRAMTVKVDATTAVEGWAGSGSFVDVLLIGKDRTTVVAEKVKILSAERSVSPVEGNASPSVPSTVTMLVTQEQCLAINTAIPLGRIAFALRSPSDEASWVNTTFTSDELKTKPTASDRKSLITGYVAVKESEDKGKRAFALSDGKWVRTDVLPSGFFASQEGQ